MAREILEVFACFRYGFFWGICFGDNFMVETHNLV